MSAELEAKNAKAEEGLSIAELRDVWWLLSPSDRAAAMRLLPRVDAEDYFLALPAREQAQFAVHLPPMERRSWIRMLAPDDVADLVQETPHEAREGLLALLDEPTRREVHALLTYAEDDAGGLMNPRFARVRPEVTVDEAMGYLRKQARQMETLHYVFVLDADQKLLGVLSLRELFAAGGDKLVHEIMHTDLVVASEQMDQEALSHLFAEHDLVAIPVLDSAKRMKGIVTVDDIVDVVQEEATEDIHKMGGTVALQDPYLTVGLGGMVKKRAGWLVILLLGEMLTATAMSFFEEEIARAVILALFVPLIISSGGNAGSQASTLVIRAMALGEVRLRDWWRVVRREFSTGLLLGGILGVIGFLRIVAWEHIAHVYGAHYVFIAVTIGVSLLGVVLWGTIVGSMLPFALRRLNFDPASASAPFVATLVDVLGLCIYFGVASVLLKGRLL